MRCPSCGKESLVWVSGWFECDSCGAHVRWCQYCQRWVEPISGTDLKECSVCLMPTESRRLTFRMRTRKLSGQDITVVYASVVIDIPEQKEFEFVFISKGVSQSIKYECVYAPLNHYLPTNPVVPIDKTEKQALRKWIRKWLDTYVWNQN